MAGYERLKTRGTAGFKRSVKTNGFMRIMTQGQKDAHKEARLNAYVSDVERQAIRERGIRKLRLVSTPIGKPLPKSEQPKVKEFKGEPSTKRKELPANYFRHHTVWGTKISRLMAK